MVLLLRHSIRGNLVIGRQYYITLHLLLNSTLDQTLLKREDYHPKCPIDLVIRNMAEDGLRGTRSYTRSFIV